MKSPKSRVVIFDHQMNVRARHRLAAFALAFAVLLVWSASGIAAESEDPRCARIQARQAYGPFDYRLRHGRTRENLKIVEDYHFTAAKQRDALRGSTRKNIWAELDYTLRAFPNHAPALYLLGLYAKKVARDDEAYFEKLTNSETYSPVPCYFQRAIRFAPDDPNVWNTLGRLQTADKDFDGAIESFIQVVKLAPGSASAHYNLGLAYYAAEKYEEAEASAKKAYALGYSRQDLARRLASKGHWE